MVIGGHTVKVLNPTYKPGLLDLGIASNLVRGLLRLHPTASFQEREGVGHLHKGPQRASRITFAVKHIYNILGKNF